MFSAVLIIPASLRDAANAVGEAMGWGPNSYSVPLITVGGGDVTHYGLRSGVSEQLIRWVKGLDPLPEGMESAAPVIEALIADFRPDPTIEDDDRPVLTNRPHFVAVLAEHGLDWPPTEET